MSTFGGRARSFATFSPVAVAAIGTLPLPVMHRPVVIHMERRDGRRPLTRLDTDDADTKADLNTAYRMMVMWASDAELASDPPMPAQLRDRQADNWRSLLAIADAFGAGATHAWADIYLPGAGWIAYDPTNGTVNGANLIRVAVTRDISQAVPVAGSFVGAPADYLGTTVDVAVPSRNA